MRLSAVVLALWLSSTTSYGACTPKTMTAILEYSIRTDPVFLSYFLPLIEVESACDPDAVSPKGAVGLTQMTPIAVKELKQAKDIDELCREITLDNVKEIKYSIISGSCYLNLMLARHEGSYILALASYNGGYRQAQRLKQGLRMLNETANYVTKVLYLREVRQAGSKESP